MAKTISATELKAMRDRGAQLVDICSPTEYAAGHLPGAVNIPMEQIETRMADLNAAVPVVLICKSGQRATATAQLVEAQRAEVFVLQGGARAWVAAGERIVVSGKTRWSLERQVRLGAGLLVLTGLLLALTVSHGWLALSALVGLGLTFAGLTDICGMAFLLAKMPWNQAPEPPANVSEDHKCLV